MYLEQGTVLAEPDALHLAGLHGVDELAVPPVVALWQAGALRLDGRGALGGELHAAGLGPLVLLHPLSLQEQ